MQTVAFGISAVIADLFGGFIYAAGGPAPLFFVAAGAAGSAAVLGWAVFPRRGAAMVLEGAPVPSTVPAAEREMPFGG